MIVENGGRGPSPRLRGKRVWTAARVLYSGSIPAPAGETASPQRFSRRSGVHPRACGGNGAVIVVFQVGSGPSPRLRGKHQVPAPGAGRLRSIPAPAGETPKRLTARRYRRVHPRACGGNFSSCLASSPRCGPSPRLRGKLHADVGVGSADGSIPAPAGETSLRAWHLRRAAVHPRACGGNGSQPAVRLKSVGPSPRLRGKRHQPMVELQRFRSIPAPAGETSGTRTGGRPPPVHPRACGGNTEAFNRQKVSEGPSPRLRGKLLFVLGIFAALRSIPAPAGETDPNRPSA